MVQVYTNRLTVVGTKSQVQRFQLAPWERFLSARHGELLESSPGRFVSQFETDRRVLGPLQRLSGRFRSLTFLLDYDLEEKRFKGLAKAYAGQLEYHEVTY